jgi:hypothetical protein
MTRDLDLVREILLAIEEKASPRNWFSPEISGYTKEEISYHIKLLIQAGLVEGKDLSSQSKFEFAASNLTWEGHEFLDASRDKSIWTKTKKYFGTRISSVSFELIKQVLIDFTKKEIGLE